MDNQVAAPAPTDSILYRRVEIISGGTWDNYCGKVVTEDDGMVEVDLDDHPGSAWVNRSQVKTTDTLPPAPREMLGGNNTPGPWATGDHDWHTILGPDTRFKEGRKALGCVATVDATENEAEDLANARLIAAAPELLHALHLCQIRVFMLEGSENEAYEAARVAIARAQGRTA